MLQYGLFVVCIFWAFNLSAQKLVIPDSSEYSTTFIEAWKNYHYMDEVVEMRKGYLLVGGKDTLLIPAQIKLGNKYYYEGKRSDTTYQMCLIRKNSSTLIYEVTITSKDKLVLNESGEVHFDPVHLITAIDGSCFNYYNKHYKIYTRDCVVHICIDGINNEEQAQFEYINCEKTYRCFFTLKKVETITK